jgi:hypothetical protein
MDERNLSHRTLPQHGRRAAKTQVGIKTRLGPDGVHMFNRSSGINILFDEIAVPAARWSVAPRQVSVALTNACDLRCPYCYAPKHSANLNYDQVTGWLKELDDGGCFGVGFGGGDPPSLEFRRDWHTARRRPWRRRARTGKPCGPGTRCWCQVGGGEVGPTGSRSALFADDGDKTNSSPGRARHKPLKPLRREGRVFRWTCGD